MQKIVQSLPIIVLLAALGVIGWHIIEARKAKHILEPCVYVAEKTDAENLPVAENLPKADRQFVLRAFNAPEELDTALIALETRSVDKAAVVHPALLSEIEPSLAVKKSVTANWKPAFQKDFESLRSEAIRNPDSEQNRTTVKTVMQKRQQRLAQKNL